MNETLKTWISTNLLKSPTTLNPSKTSIKYLKPHFPENLNSLLELTSFLPQETKMSERIYCIINNIENIVLCKTCNTNKSNFVNFKKGYGKFCSCNCSSLNISTQKKVKQTKLEKYGDPNYNNRPQAIKTCQEKWGVDNPMYLENTKKIIVKTNLKHLNVEYPMQSEEVRKLSRKTREEKYGDPNYNNIPKARKTRKERYGDPNYGLYGSQSFKNKMLKKYGVEHPNQNSYIADRMERGFKNSWHIHTLPSGKQINIQGYEPIALDMLLNEYDEDDILYKRTDMPEIWYQWEDKTWHRYYPDFYIPKNNLVIEVKSEYIYKLEIPKNLLKWQSTKEIGYDFKLFMFNKKRKLIDTTPI